MSYREVLGSLGAQKIREAQPAGEINWKHSHTFCAALANCIDKNGYNDLPSNFLSVIEPFVNSILECAISDRTTLSKDACRLTGNLPKVLGRDMHPLIDRVLPVMIRHCGTRKQVNQKNGDAAITSIVTYSTYSPRLLYHVCAAFEDKNTPPRLYGTGWLKLILQEYPKSLHGRDYETVAHAVHLSLEDADSAVRTQSRGLFWQYHKTDPVGAQEVMAKLNTHALTALRNDPNNPEKGSTTTAAANVATRETSRPTSALAEARQQAKKRMKERMAEKPKASSPQAHVGIDFPGYEPEPAPAEAMARPRKPVRDAPRAPTPSQGEGQHMLKNAARPITSQHKKGTSHDGQLSQITKKLSTMEMDEQHSIKKRGSADGLRTSQNKKPPSTVGESQNARGLLSAPMRRPRIVATPINAPPPNVPPQPSSRPSSRTGPPPAPAVHTDSYARPTKELPPARPDSRDAPEHPQVADVMRPVKASRKIPRTSPTSPVLTPDGKENTEIYPSPKKFDSQHSPVRVQPEFSQQDHVFEHHPPRAGLDADVRPSSQDSNRMSPAIQRSPEATAIDTNINEARRALVKAIDLLKRDALDYMGFRKLRKLVSQFGRDLILEQEYYDALFKELLPRLGSMEELMDREDTAGDNKHPMYIRQAILHMMHTLISQYPHEWSYPFLAPSLAAIMIIRCTYSSAEPRTSPQKSPHNQSSASRNSTIDLLDETVELIVETSTNPLDQLDTIIDVLHSGEDFLMSASPTSLANTPTASFSSSLKSSQSRSSPHSLPSPRSPTSPRLPLPSKVPFLMETGLKIITRMLRKSRVYDLALALEQESALAELAQHLLDTYSSLIRHQVMLFCREFYKIVVLSRDGHAALAEGGGPEGMIEIAGDGESEGDRVFWEYFPRESDRNLIHYHIEGLRR